MAIIDYAKGKGEEEGGPGDKHAKQTIITRNITEIVAQMIYFITKHLKAAAGAGAAYQSSTNSLSKFNIISHGRVCSQNIKTNKSY